MSRGKSYAYYVPMLTFLVLLKTVKVVFDVIVDVNSLGVTNAGLI